LLKRAKRGRPQRPAEPSVRINDKIVAREIFLVGDDGTQHGVVSVPHAIRIAEETGLDVVEVAPNAKPPVCRIMDYGKFRFEQAKKDKQSKKNQTVIKVKEIKLHPKTAENDYNYRMKQAKDFLEKGLKVKVTMFFRGREMAHQDYGKRLMDKAKEELEPVSEVEQESRMEGNNMTSVFAPLKTPKKGSGKQKQEGGES